jgi:hypothetical protein
MMDEQTTPAEHETPAQPEETPGPRSPKLWRAEIAASELARKTLVSDWKENVENRVQKVFGEGEVTSDTVAVPEDWARTKQKIAQLMFQVPKIILTPKSPERAPAAPIFQAVLNHKLHHEIKAEVMLDECLADVVNASGLMVSKVGIDIYTEPKEVPAVDLSQLPPEVQAQLLQSGEVPMETVEQTIAQRYRWDRISPAAFLWPAEFTGSDWDAAPWLGHETWLLVEEARKQFKLPEDFEPPTESKPQLLSESVRETPRQESATGYVKVQEVWYKAYLYDTDAVHPDHIRRIVFIDGVDAPVIHEDSPWQRWVEPSIDQQAGVEKPGSYVGARKLPIRVATLTYVSDLAVPPSDTRAGRPQVRELSRSRSQMLRQRSRSIPMRWADPNRIDADIFERIQNGDWQDIIPISGRGDGAIGEVARANYPRENFTFQNIIGQDLDRAWSLSNNQLASQADSNRSATEANLIQSAANTRLEYEKARVARYVIGGVEVLAGLVQMFTDHAEYVELVGPDGAKRMEVWDQSTTAGEWVFDIVPDSGDRIDPTVRQERILKLYNLAANDPTINREALTRQLVESYGMDPTLVMKQAPPPKPDDPNISYRFSGEDLLNPMAVALLLKAHPDFGPQQIQAAATMIQDAMRQMQTPQQPPQPPQGGPGGPPPGPGGQPPPVEPPDTVSPILKRAVDGSRMT